MPNSAATTQATAMHVFPSDLGWMALAYRGGRLVRMTMGHPSAAAASASLAADGIDSVGEPPHADEVPPWVVELASRLQSFAAGHDESFADVPLDLAHLSEFQMRVVRACRRIGRGRVRTYGELAAQAGSPAAARAVGTVMSRNRFPIIVPCHRVVASGGTIGGFSARNGVTLKRRMLLLEGAPIKERRR
jgi:methylated-DNA-[protein]-cysteine S-methyltransferase